MFHIVDPYAKRVVADVERTHDPPWVAHEHRHLRVEMTVQQVMSAFFERYLERCKVDLAEERNQIRVVSNPRQRLPGVIRRALSRVACPPRSS